MVETGEYRDTQQSCVTGLGNDAGAGAMDPRDYMLLLPFLSILQGT